MKKILMFPQKKTPQNSYLGNLTEIISSEFEVIGFNEALKSKKKIFFSYDIVHFNWLENIRGKSRFVVWLNFFIRFFTLLYFRLRGKPIIWSVHNKVAHCRGRGEHFSKIMMRYLMKWSDRIHILCEESFEEIPDLKCYKEKIICIPHGDYIGDYPKSDVNVFEKYGIPKEKKIILFIGVVDRYKNVDLLIKSFSNSGIAADGFVLLVCGACSEKSYMDQLVMDSSNNSAIYLDFNFVPVEMMDAYLRQCSLLVAPYDKESTLNSGTLWMAFSYAKVVICPKIGCVRSLVDAEKMMYCYDYDSEESHQESLKLTFKRAKDDLKKGLLQGKGLLAFEYIKSQSWLSNRKLWRALYEF